MRQRGFGLLEAVLAIGVLSTLFITGIFLAKESLGVRKLEKTRESLELLSRSFYAYGSIPTDDVQFERFLNAILKTDLDPFSRGYRLILASSVDNNAVASVCSAQNTDLAVRMPDGRVLTNVVAVLLSAGEDGTYDTFTQNRLPNQSVVRVSRNARSPLLLQPTDVFTAMTLPEFKVKNCILPSAEDMSHYARLTVGNTRPSNPEEGDLFYHLTNKTLEKYTNGTWVGIDWQAIVKASPEYRAGRLRVQNNQLQISPDGVHWFNCIPAVGANTIELATVDNVNYSYLYWIPPGTTAIVRNANHLPIVYTPAVEPAFSATYWHNMAYQWWIGLRPSSVAISDGDGQGIGGMDGPSSVAISMQGIAVIDNMDSILWIGRSTNLSIVPIFEQSNVEENWAHFSLNIRINQRWLTTAIGQGNRGYEVLSSVGSGTAPPTSYWLGTWFTMHGYQFTMTRIAITRLS